MENVHIMEHPLIRHKISRLRDENTGTNEFRKLTEEIAMLMGYEALRRSSFGKMWKVKNTDRNMQDSGGFRQKAGGRTRAQSRTGNGKRDHCSGARGKDRTYRAVPGSEDPRTS